MRFLVLILSLAAAELPPVSLRVSPKLANPPLDRVRIEVVIPRHADNRGWCLVVDGPDLYSSSCGPLDGEEAPVILVRDVLALNKAGRYEVRGELYRKGSRKPFSTAKSFVQVGAVLAASELDSPLPE